MINFNIKGNESGEFEIMDMYSWERLCEHLEKMETSNTFIDIIVCTPEYISCIHFSLLYEAITVIGIQWVFFCFFLFVFWLKSHPFFWAVAVFHSSSWSPVRMHDLESRNGHMPKTEEFWLKKAGDGPVLVFAHILDLPLKSAPHYVLFKMKKAHVQCKEINTKKIKNLRWVGRGKN